MRMTMTMCVALVLAGCGAGGHVPMQVQAEQAPMANIQAYRTFGWLHAPLASNGADDRAAIFDWRLRNAVDAGLMQKGYAKALPGQNADFLVVYDVSLKNKNTESFQEWARYRARGGTQGLGNAFMDGYKEGTLVLQMIDGKTRTLVWRGSASAVLDPGSREGQRVDEAVRLMLAKFPARA